MTPKRPRDPNQLRWSIFDIARRLESVPTILHARVNLGIVFAGSSGGFERPPR
jgi:hypothetical protein